MKKTILILTNLLIALPILANEAHEAAEHGEVQIPFHDISIQAINLGILLIALIIFVRKPIQNIFKAKRDLFLEDSIKTAAALKKAEDELKESKEKLKELESGSTNSINQAEKEAQVLAQKIVVDSEAQAKKMIEDTNLIISAEITKAKNLIRQKMIDASLIEAEKNIKTSSATITQNSEKSFLDGLGQVK